MFTENNCPLFVLKRKIPNEWMGRLEAWHSRHFTASSSQALILHEKTSQPLGTNSGKADEFWWVARGRYPHLPKKLTYRSPPVREGPPNPTRTHSSSHTRGCFRCEGFVLGRVLFSFNQELQGLHKNKRKIQGSLLTGKELKANRSLGDVAFFARNWKKSWGFLLPW